MAESEIVVVIKAEGVDRFVQELKKAGIAVEKTGDTTQKATKKIDGNLKKLGGSLVKFAGVLGVAFSAQAIIRFATESVKAFGVFETSLKDLEAITGLTGDALTELSDNAKRLSANSTKSASEVLTAFKLIGSAKPELLSDVDALTELTEASITLAEASGLTLPEASSNLGNALNALQLPASEAGRLINVLASASQQGSREIPFVADALSKFGGIASDAGVSVEESVSAIEILGKAIPEASIVGNNLKNVLLTLQQQAEKNGREFGSLSEELDFLAKQNLNVTETTKIFGKENVLAINTLLNSKDAFDDLTIGITGTDTALKQQAIATSGLESQQKKLRNTVELLQIEIGEKLAEAFVPVILGLTELIQTQSKFETRSKFLQAVIDAFRRGFEQTQKVIKTFGLAFKAVGELLTSVARLFGFSGDSAELFRRVLFGLQGVTIRFQNALLGVVKRLTNFVNGITNAINRINNFGKAVKNFLRIGKGAEDVIDDQTEATNGLGEASEETAKKVDDLTQSQKDLIDEYALAKGITAEYTKDVLKQAEAWEKAKGDVTVFAGSLESLGKLLKSQREELQKLDPDSTQFGQLIAQSLETEARIAIVTKQLEGLSKIAQVKIDAEGLLENAQLEIELEIKTETRIDEIDDELDQLETLISERLNSLDEGVDPLLDETLIDFKNKKFALETEAKALKETLDEELGEPIDIKVEINDAEDAIIELGDGFDLLAQQIKDAEDDVTSFWDNLIENSERVKDIQKSFLELAQSGADSASGLNASGIIESVENIITLFETPAEGKAKFLQGLSVASSALNTFSEFSTAISEKRLERIQAQRERGLITEKQFARKSAEIARQQAIQNKAIAISQAVINTAVGITSVLKEGIPGLVLKGLIGALGAIQVGLILSTPIPEIPAFAKGTKGGSVAPPGAKIVGEQGAEMLVDSGGYKVIDNKDTREISKILAKYGVPVMFETTPDQINRPLSNINPVVLNDSDLGDRLDWNPLLNSNDRNRMTLGKKLDRINENLVQINRSSKIKLNARI